MVLNSYDDFVKLGIGTEFYVCNGNWYGRIVLDRNFDPAILVIKDPIAGMKVRHEPVKIQKDFNRKLIVTEIEVPKYNNDEYMTKEYFDYLTSICDVG